MILLFRISSSAAPITLVWDANTEPDLAGYKIHWGSEPGSYCCWQDAGNVTQWSSDIPLNSYIAATAYDSDGKESGYSNEIYWSQQESYLGAVNLNASQFQKESQPMAVTLRQVEKITASLTGTSVDVTLTTTLLDTSKAFLVFGVRSNHNQPQHNLVHGNIINTTTVRFGRYATSGTINIIGYVVEFTAGVTVERGSLSMDWPSVSGDITLSSITDLSKSFRLASHQVHGSTYSADDIVTTYLWDDAGTKKLHWQRNDSSEGTHTLQWQVVQYDDCSVQRGSITTISTTDTSKTENISSVSLTKSFLLFDFRAEGGTAANIASKLIRGKFNSATQLIFERDSAGSLAISDLRYEVVEFTDAVTVQEISEAFASSDGQEDATITEVSALTKAIAFASGRMREGKGAYTGDDIPGESWFTAELTTTTNLQTKRNSTNSTADAVFYVVDFGAATAGTTKSVAGSIPAMAGALSKKLMAKRTVQGAI